MSEVYPAFDLASGAKKVAVKLFRKGEIEDDILKETYEREVRALKELKHPSIVELLDSGVDKERVTANGLTALRVADAAGHPEIVEFLQGCGAD